MGMAHTKICFKCNRRKPLTSFYEHEKMADGHLGKCKTCTKNDVRKNYGETREERSEYERRRYKDPARRKRMIAYQRELRLRNPGKYRARMAVQYAIRVGKLVRQPCLLCRTTVQVQAHHHDYRKPLDVDWLCFKCHREKEHGQVVTTKE
jgi:hypothetical protein